MSMVAASSYSNEKPTIKSMHPWVMPTIHALFDKKLWIRLPKLGHVRFYKLPGDWNWNAHINFDNHIYIEKDEQQGLNRSHLAPRLLPEWSQ